MTSSSNAWTDLRRLRRWLQVLQTDTIFCVCDSACACAHARARACRRPCQRWVFVRRKTTPILDQHPGLPSHPAINGVTTAVRIDQQDAPMSHSHSIFLFNGSSANFFSLSLYEAAATHTHASTRAHTHTNTRALPCHLPPNCRKKHEWFILANRKDLCTRRRVYSERGRLQTDRRRLYVPAH